MTKERINYHIIKQSTGNLWAFFYDDSEGICYMTCDNDHWSKKQRLYSSGSKNFSVYLDKQDNIYLYCQDSSGNIILYQNTAGKWESQVLLYSKNGFIDSLSFDAIIENDNFYLFYNLKDPNSNRHALVEQKATSGKQWKTPALIDYIYPLDKKPFTIYKDNQDNIFISYQKYSEYYQLGYKKYSASSKNWSDFLSFDKSHFSFTDESILASQDELFNLYIKKEAHYSTLYFRSKTDNQWKEAKKLFEKADISSCSLFMIDDHLWAAWICQDKLYSCYSTDRGNSFSEAAIHLIEEPALILKAHYQSNFPEEEKRLLCNEIYILTNPQIKFLILPEVFPAINGTNIQINHTFIPATEKVDNYLNEIKIHLNQLYEEIYICKKQLREKENQINQLKYSLKVKNKDISKTAYDFSKINEQQKKELTALKERIKKLEEELTKKNEKIKQLEEKNTALKKGMDILKKELETRKAPLIITTDSGENKKEKGNKPSIFKKIFSFEEENS